MITSAIKISIPINHQIHYFVDSQVLVNVVAKRKLSNVSRSLYYISTDNISFIKIPYKYINIPAFQISLLQKKQVTDALINSYGQLAGTSMEHPLTTMLCIVTCDITALNFPANPPNVLEFVLLSSLTH